MDNAPSCDYEPSPPTKLLAKEQHAVKLLVDAGTNAALKDDDGMTALDYAKEKGQKEAVALLENPGS